MNSRIYGLRAGFALSIIIYACIGAVLFCCIYFPLENVMTEYFNSSDFEEKRISEQGKSLQNFIDKNNISSDELTKLKAWERRQPLILLEIYTSDGCIYSSFYDEASGFLVGADVLEGLDNMVNICFADQSAMVVMYSDFTYKYYVIGVTASAIISLFVFMMLFLRSTRKMIQYITRLCKEVQILEGGDLDYILSVEGNNEITDLATSMNRMRTAFQKQMLTEQELYQANHKLITEMSHDLRTPLTSIMLYLEILKTHRYTSREEAESYLEKIYTKAHQMKRISDHLFDYAQDISLGKENAPTDMKEAFGSTIQMFCDDLRAHGFTVNTDLNWSLSYVHIEPEYIQRIFDNILSNIVKYAQEKEEVYVGILETDQYCGFSVMNTCAVDDPETESHGIGIESIKNLMKQMNGICTVEQTESMFEITVLFARI